MAHIKLGRFSGERTEKNALQSNAAHIAISGIEVDYDAGLMSLDETEKLLRKVNVAAFLYTSPSHDPLNRKHRWRALCPCSKELSPSGRAQLVARLNGALGGVLANESFTASQSFTFGYVFGKTTPDVRLIDGRFVDQCDDLDANAIGKREKNLSEPMAAVDLSNDTGRVKAAAAMLRQSAKRLAATIQGENRNGALAREAFLLRGLIANNLVQPDDVFDAFLPALESNGYLAAYGGEKDATRIITTQLKHGALRPVDPLPDLSHMLTLEDVPEATTTGPKKSSMIDPDDWDDLIGLAPPPGMVAPDWGSPITLGNGQLVNNLSNTIHILGRHIDSIVPGLRFNKLNHEME
ncbi:hypothetical protein [Ruegeria sp. HKCCA5426]|uniref:hypothetical protein n=1 Tax=Ruegeria sp. HKCCA5426 TaxID=2682985 RepID=UPI001488829F|nr:hypothetical protein [Ruegeria sp. HKCCA5426]